MQCKHAIASTASLEPIHVTLGEALTSNNTYIRQDPDVIHFHYSVTQ